MFVSNVLNGTVVRLDVAVSDNRVQIMKVTQIASGYLHRVDAAALVVRPTGLAYDPQRDLLYVASSVDNAIFAVSGARNSNHDGGKGVLVYADNRHLHDPLGLVIGPNGDLFAANGDAINADLIVVAAPIFTQASQQGCHRINLAVGPNEGLHFDHMLQAQRSERNDPAPGAQPCFQC